MLYLVVPHTVELFELAYQIVVIEFATTIKCYFMRDQHIIWKIHVSGTFLQKPLCKMHPFRMVIGGSETLPFGDKS